MVSDNGSDIRCGNTIGETAAKNETTYKTEHYRRGNTLKLR